MCIRDRRENPADESEVQQLKEIVADECHSLLDIVVSESLPVPKVGFEVVDDADIVVCECELAWPQQKVAILTPDQIEGSKNLTENGWVIYSSGKAQESISEVVSKLKKG